MSLPSFSIRYRTALLAFLAFAGSNAMAAERLSLDSFAITGGGGRSNPVTARGRFAISGTVGQKIAAPVLNSIHDRYQVEAGFWQGIVVVETPRAPRLEIRRGSPGTLVLSWPIHVSDFVLEETVSVDNPNGWVRTFGVSVDTATEHTLKVQAMNGVKFYRLRKD